MKVQLLDRVTTRRIEKYQTIFKVFAAICALVAIITTACVIFISFVKTTQFWFDYSVALLLPFIYMAATFEIGKKRKGQFIEWWTDRIVFKTKHDSAINTIQLDDIATINIERTIIEIVKLGKDEFNIDLDDFTDFDMREHIKENFERLNFNRKRKPAAGMFLVPVTKQFNS